MRRYARGALLRADALALLIIALVIVSYFRLLYFIHLCLLHR